MSCLGAAGVGMRVYTAAFAQSGPRHFAAPGESPDLTTLTHPTPPESEVEDDTCCWNAHCRKRHLLKCFGMSWLGRRRWRSGIYRSTFSVLPPPFRLFRCASEPLHPRPLSQAPPNQQNSLPTLPAPSHQRLSDRRRLERAVHSFKRFQE